MNESLHQHIISNIVNQRQHHKSTGKWEIIILYFRSSGLRYYSSLHGR
jgi:hypothetical protein